MVGACSAISGGGGDAPPPKALSAHEYATTLTESLDPLDSALKRLGAANTYKGLEGRVGAVETSAHQVINQLTPLVPPAELADAHTQLVSSLKAFETKVGNVAEQVNDRALCTGSTVRAGLGDAEATAALSSALAAVSAALPDSLAQLTVSLPADDQKLGSRPTNGKILRSRDLDGQGQLTIDNGSSRDAVVTITKGRKATVSVYVRKGKTYTVERVPDGRYTVFFTGGAETGTATHAPSAEIVPSSDSTPPWDSAPLERLPKVLYQTYRITLQSNTELVEAAT